MSARSWHGEYPHRRLRKLRDEPECREELEQLCPALRFRLSDQTNHGDPCRIWTRLRPRMVRCYLWRSADFLISDSGVAELKPGIQCCSCLQHHARAAIFQFCSDSCRWQLSVAGWRERSDSPVVGSSANARCLEFDAAAGDYSDAVIANWLCWQSWRA